MDDKQPTEIQSDEIFDPMQYLGETLTTAKDKYEISDYLGEGLTAVVFKARQISTGSHCALKLLRPTASSLSKLNFWEELNIIRKLRSNGLQSVPNVLDYQKDQALEFLVMDLIVSEEYPGLHQILKSRLFLSEEEALAIFSEALALLNNLHTAEQRTYIDMQLKNFCWNSGKQNLIVMDWNHVSYTREVIEAELEKEPDQRNVDVMQQLRGRGAKNFDDLVQLDLRRLTAYFYTLLTGKAANEMGETAWSLESRAGEIWDTISLPSRQIVLRVLTPRNVQGKLDSATRILAEVEFAQKLLETNDIDDLQNKFDEYFDKSRHAETKEQPDEMYRAAAYLDRIERVNDPRFLRWLNSQKSRLQEVDGSESPDWRKGRNFFNIGSFDEARRYWDQEANALGKVQPWRWALLARICADTRGALTEEKQKLLTHRLESAIGNLQHQESIQKGKADFQYTQELVSHEVIDWWLEEIQALTLLDNLEQISLSNEPGETAEKLDEITTLSFWDKLPYTRILLRDEVWYVAAQKILGLSQAEKLRSDETRTLHGVFQTLSQELRAKQHEISSWSDLLDRLQNLEFESFKEELKKALYKRPNNPDLVRAALEYISNRKPRERLEIIDILSNWAHLDNELKMKVMECRKDLYRALFEKLATEAKEAVENQNMLLALDYLNKSKLALRTLHGLGWEGIAEQEEIDKLNDRIGAEENIEKMRRTRAQIFQLGWDIEDLMKSTQIKVHEIQSKIWSAKLQDPANINAALEESKKDLEQLQALIAQVPEAERDIYLAMYTKLSSNYNLCTQLNQSNDLQDYQNHLLDAKKRFEEIKKKSDQTGKRAESAELQRIKEEVQKARKIKNSWIRADQSKQAR